MKGDRVREVTDMEDMEGLAAQQTVVMDPNISNVFLAKMELLLTLMVVIFAMLCILLTILLLM